MLKKVIFSFLVLIFLSFLLINKTYGKENEYIFSLEDEITYNDDYKKVEVVNNDYIFGLNGEITTYDGFLRVYEEMSIEAADPERLDVLPEMNVGDHLIRENIEIMKILKINIGYFTRSF